MENTEGAPEVEEKKASPESSEDTQGEQKEALEQEADSNAETTVEQKESQEQESYKDKFYYLAAELQNQQKRYERERENFLKFGNEKILKDMVDVVDNFERALEHIEVGDDEKVKNIVEGIEMIQKVFMDTLAKYGLKKIEALGSEFDPNFHEALAHQPAEDKKDMEIILVHQDGYTLNERVIRAAKVIVAKNK